jgi:hypothetical protein
MDFLYPILHLSCPYVVSRIVTLTIPYDGYVTYPCIQAPFVFLSEATPHCYVVVVARDMLVICFLRFGLGSRQGDTLYYAEGRCIRVFGLGQTVFGGKLVPAAVGPMAWTLAAAIMEVGREWRYG